MWKKVLIGTFILLITLATATYFYLPTFASNKIYTALESADSVSFSKIYLNLYDGDIVIHDFYLSDSSGSVLKVPLHTEVQSFRLRGLNVSELLLNKRLKLDTLFIDKGILQVLIPKKDTSTKQTSNGKQVLKSIQIGHTTIDSLALNLLFDLIDSTDRTSAMLNFTATDFYVPMANLLQSQGQNIVLNFKNIYSRLKDRVGYIDIDEFDFNKGHKKLRINGFKLRQKLSTRQYAKHFGFDKLHAEVDVDSIVVEEMPVRVLDILEKLELTRINIYKPVGKLYKDKRFPHPSKVQKFPFEAISEIDFPILIDTVNIIDGEIWFKELTRNDGQTAKLDLTSINAQVLNITSLGPNKQSDWTEVKGKVVFYHQLPFDFSWKFDLRKKGTSFVFDGKIGSAPLSVLNPFLLNSANARFKSGYLEGGRLLAEGNKISGEGSLKFNYSKMKIELLEKTSHEKDFGLNLVGGTANILIRNNNRKDKKEVVGAVYAEPAQNKFIVVYLWRLLASGMQDIIIGSKNQSKSEDRRNEYIKQKER